VNIVGLASEIAFLGSGGVWLTRWAGWAGDPSLRLKNGSAQDDKAFLDDSGLRMTVVVEQSDWWDTLGQNKTPQPQKSHGT